MHITTLKWSRILFFPLIRFCEWLGVEHPVFLVRIRYFARFHVFPDLRNPKNINEKILYMKLFTDTSEWTRLADKYTVREYLKECGLEEFLVPLIGKWTNVEDVDFNNLPKSFIFKSNNGCGKGSNLIVQDKYKLDIKQTKAVLEAWLKEKNVGALASEPQYKGITPCVLAEELLQIPKGQKSIIDYKIWCFNGKAHFVWVCTDRDRLGTDVMTYDLEWNAHPEYCVFDYRYRKGNVIPRPSNFDKMIEIAEILSKPFPCVRVDLYNIDGKIYFGEMTFTSLGGMMNFYTDEFLTMTGNMIDLNYPNKKHR